MFTASHAILLSQFIPVRLIDISEIFRIRRVQRDNLVPYSIKIFLLKKKKTNLSSESLSSLKYSISDRAGTRVQSFAAPGLLRTLFTVPL